MRVACFLLLAVPLAASTSSLHAATAASAPRDARRAESRWTPETVDEAWAAKVLAEPEYDRGWLMPCHDDWNDELESACEVRELPFDPGKGPIAIHGGANGGMTVIGWDRAQPRVIYRVRARAKTVEEARTLASSIRLEIVNGWMRPRGPEAREGQRWSVEVKAWVPRASDLSLTTRNGPMSVCRVKGTMDLHSLNGPIALSELAGAVSARVQNGPLQVDLSGAKWDGAGLDAEAENGPVALRVPRGYSARLRGGTVNGPSSVDFPISLEGRLRGHFATTLGSGGPIVRVVTTNGPFQMSER